MSESKLSGAYVKQFRKRQGWSAYQLGVELGGYTRAYVKSIEGGSLPITERFAIKFQQLEQVTYRDAKARGTLHSRCPLPNDLTILARPRKCLGCKRWVILPYAHQKYCDVTCKRVASRQRRK